MNKPNSEALRRGLYVGATVQNARDKRQQLKITSFNEDGDPMWDFVYNCEHDIGKVRFPTIGSRTSTGLEGTGAERIVSTERFVHIEIPEGLHAEAIALLMTHFEGRK